MVTLIPPEFYIDIHGEAQGRFADNTLHLWSPARLQHEPVVLGGC